MKRRLGQQPIGADIRWLRVLLGRAGLSQPGGWLPFAVYSYLPANQATAGAVFAVTISRPFVIRSWTQAVHVATTNNGSNYWTFALKRISDHATLHSINTSAISPDTWVRFAELGLDISVVNTNLALYVDASKTGSPGNYYATGPAVFVV